MPRPSEGFARVLRAGARARRGGRSRRWRRAIVAAPGVLAILVGDGQPAPVVVARSRDIGFDAGAWMKRAAAQLGGRGGGRPEQAQGGLTAPAETIVAFARQIAGSRRPRGKRRGQASVMSIWDGSPRRAAARAACVILNRVTIGAPVFDAVFKFLFKYQPLVFEQGKFVLGASRSMSLVVVLAGAAALYALWTYRQLVAARGARARGAARPARRPVRAGAVRAAAPDAAAQDRRAAAELRRRAGGRLAQHADCRSAGQAAQRVRQGSVRPRGRRRCWRRSASGFSCGCSGFLRAPSGCSRRAI